MAIAARRLLRSILVQIGRLICWILFRITIEGRENIPRNTKGLLVISNHFSWFDAPLISLLLPYPPAYLIATEAIANKWIRPFTTVFESIPIWRGQVDRQALATAVRVMRADGIVGIFPEGGINPDLADVVAKGQQVAELQGNMSRVDGALIRAKSGVALLATLSGAQILPVALLGSQHILTNLRQRQRTSITLRIGSPFGPLALDSELKGAARRRQMDQLADEMMRHIAILMPPEHHGHYADEGTGNGGVRI